MEVFSGPDELYGELFQAVQGGRLFADSKAFADAVPLRPAAEIRAAFAALTDRSGPALRQFVLANFRLPEDGQPPPAVATSLRGRIDELWDVLRRAPEPAAAGGSLIALPRPYVVPGGRFREVYYWDAYFTMLGLAESGRISLVEDMVENFAYLIDRVGFVPNANRTYFCSRSQPPYFVLMAQMLARLRGDPDLLARFRPQLEREYGFWMRGAEGAAADGPAARADRRVVGFRGAWLNRYFDDADGPRPESHAEDVNLARHSRRPAAHLYRDLRAACESGWDFSARWLAVPSSLASIRTTRILPVDLNALLCHLETVLAGLFEPGSPGAADYAARAARRAELLTTDFFDASRGLFVDLIADTGRPTGVASLACVYPLYLGIATDAQAARVAEVLEREFLAPGGWRSSLITSGQQWDRPNGWAPMQWLTYEGLRRYGFDALARRGAEAWVSNCEAVYQRTGRLLEKYDVEAVGTLAVGGEYAVQDGFGWTNGVLLALMNRLGGAGAATR